MEKGKMRTVSGILLMLLMLGTLTLALNVRPVKSSPATITVPDNYPTIQAAVNAANPYDTIIVRDGDYPENVTVNKSNLTIMGQYRHTAVVEGWFYLSNVSYVTIANFTILGPYSYMSAGITFEQSSFNTIRNNVISSWYHGLYFDYLNHTDPNEPVLETASCHNNTILENNITNISDSAIFFMEGLTYNRFYHNNFYNTIVDYMLPDVEFWDNGYPSGGNYWNGCTIIDSKWGPNQDQPGHDGINDTQYMVYGENYGGIPGFDHYPLTSPWSPPDIAVTSVTPSKTVVGEGTVVYINTTLLNNGSKVEVFNVTVYANTSVIGTFLNVIFVVGSGSGVCSWDTTGFAEGNYTIKSVADPVEGEVSTSNNNCTYGLIAVTIPGDLNGDFKVGLSDLSILAKAYNTKPGDAKWNPNADINGDGKVSLSDLSILAKHYNQHYP
ncbi:MAG: dockerin type I domain-containing protein [Candidatus Bathyarchaeia archaeon]